MTDPANPPAAVDTSPETLLQFLDKRAESMVRIGCDDEAVLLSAAVALIRAQAAENARMGWQGIESAPKDGTWFVVFMRDAYGGVEAGRYKPYYFDEFIETEDGLFKKERRQIGEWEGFNNFQHATHWTHLPPTPPSDGEAG